MCGIVAFVGKPDLKKLSDLVYESGVRGLHNYGKKVFFDKAGIYHSRYCTSGETNQPIEVSGRWLAFNGVIDMGTRAEMESKYNIAMDSDNDGEVILRLCNTPSQAIDFLRNSSATFAGVWLQAGKLVAMRNEGRPLWASIQEPCTYLASTKDIFVRAGFEEEFIHQLEPLKVYEWNF